MVEKGWSAFVREYKVVLLIVIVGFFLIELQILVMSSMKSGRQSWLKVVDDGGQIIYEVKGSTLTNFNKYYFENTFGSLDQYQVKLYTKEIPFPFRAWLSASVGIPVGLVLLLAFVLKAFKSLIQGRDEEVNLFDDKADNPQGRAQRLLSSAGRLNIFIIGFLLISVVLLYWIVPNMLTFLAKAGIETFENYKYFFMGIIGVLFLLFAWFMYMRYQLAKKSMDAQTEIRKFELQLQHERQLSGVPALGYDSGEKPQLIGYEDVEAEDAVGAEK
ncbi:hypothetical protein SAMN02746065_10525 [Desulfocicer vacuolatum DSM 3385]|uniref:Uncharacterized protein n=1 Tax=Desulfocicer vacuolatum DSM 3385 TaxID=1121400 RepID=A0A1W2AG39_9BACT|nr:hypothetical protein [Desulfocicer vacuolatum]SMC59208.1 hypothetical protein SAMN02746065_10525 [Desulfocicer vacuolatum DSM 3385]